MEHLQTPRIGLLPLPESQHKRCTPGPSMVQYCMRSKNLKSQIVTVCYSIIFNKCSVHQGSDFIPRSSTADMTLGSSGPPGQAFPSVAGHCEDQWLQRPEPGTGGAGDPLMILAKLDLRNSMKRNKQESTGRNVIQMSYNILHHIISFSSFVNGGNI